MISFCSVDGEYKILYKNAHLYSVRMEEMMVDFLRIFIDKNKLSLYVIILGGIALATKLMSFILTIKESKTTVFILLVVFALYFILALIVFVLSIAVIIGKETLGIFAFLCLIISGWILFMLVKNWDFYELAWYEITGDNYNGLMLLIEKGGNMVDILKKFGWLADANIFFSGLVFFWRRQINNIDN